jgi:hypothetical protein
LTASLKSETSAQDETETFVGAVVLKGDPFTSTRETAPIPYMWVHKKNQKKSKKSAKNVNFFSRNLPDP